MVDTVNRVQASVRLFHLPPGAFLLPGSATRRDNASGYSGVCADACLYVRHAVVLVNVGQTDCATL